VQHGLGARLPHGARAGLRGAACQLQPTAGPPLQALLARVVACGWRLPPAPMRSGRAPVQLLLHAGQQGRAREQRGESSTACLKASNWKYTAAWRPRLTSHRAVIGRAQIMRSMNICID